MPRQKPPNCLLLDPVNLNTVSNGIRCCSKATMDSSERATLSHLQRPKSLAAPSHTHHWHCSCPAETARRVAQQHSVSRRTTFGPSWPSVALALPRSRRHLINPASRSRHDRVRGRLEAWTAIGAVTAAGQAAGAVRVGDGCQDEDGVVEVEQLTRARRAGEGKAVRCGCTESMLTSPPAALTALQYPHLTPASSPSSRSSRRQS